MPTDQPQRTQTAGSRRIWVLPFHAGSLAVAVLGATLLGGCAAALLSSAPSPVYAATSTACLPEHLTQDLVDHLHILVHW